MPQASLNQFGIRRLVEFQGKRVAVADDVVDHRLRCPDCGKLCGNQGALATHRWTAHRGSAAPDTPPAEPAPLPDAPLAEPASLPDTPLAEPASLQARDLQKAGNAIEEAAGQLVVFKSTLRSIFADGRDGKLGASWEDTQRTAFATSDTRRRLLALF